MIYKNDDTICSRRIVYHLEPVLIQHRIVCENEVQDLRQIGRIQGEANSSISVGTNKE